MPDDPRPDLWIRDSEHDTVELAFRVEKTLFSRRSRFQQIDIVQSLDHGLILLNDGVVMFTERDEFIYHEMIAHVPLFVHPAPRSVLVIGGGDGGTVREVLKHPDLERVVLVEIDEVVVEACRDHFPSVRSAFADPRLEVRFEDGLQYVAESGPAFDIAIVDSTDPIGPGAGLFEQPFYENVARRLADDGILVTQAESPFYHGRTQREMLANQRPFFRQLHLYLYPTLAYPGSLYSFGFASKGPHPATDIRIAAIRQTDIHTRYYNTGVHTAAFMLPNFVKDALGDLLDPIE
jgi:spermidine synthase